MRDRVAITVCLSGNIVPDGGGDFNVMIQRLRMSEIQYVSHLMKALMLGAVLLLPFALRAQRPDAELIDKRNAMEKELESVATIDRKLMIPMRDGKRMAADVYRPKDESKKYPIIFVRTPYNFNYWDVKLGAPRDMSSELEAVKRGYAYVEMNERGHFFSEGTYDILGAPLSDGDD